MVVLFGWIVQTAVRPCDGAHFLLIIPFFISLLFKKTKTQKQAKRRDRTSNLRPQRVQAIPLDHYFSCDDVRMVYSMYTISSGHLATMWWHQDG